jgi:hypothetical protein
MKNLITIFIVLFSVSIISAQVEIDNTIHVSSGGILYLGQTTNVNTNGKLESAGGNVVFYGEVTGDDKIDLDENTNLEIQNATLTLSNENDEEINNLLLQSSGVIEVEPGNTLYLNGDLMNLNSSTGLKLLANSTDRFSQL